MENTSFSKDFSKKWQDHLHIRGEYINSAVFNFELAGSPPHTWRILYYQDNEIGDSGITSTYVENTTVKN